MEQEVQTVYDHLDRPLTVTYTQPTGTTLPFQILNISYDYDDPDNTVTVEEKKTGFGGGEAQNRPQTFASREHAVTHRLMQRPGKRGRFGKSGLESAIDRAAPGFQVGGEVVHGPGKMIFRGPRCARPQRISAICTALSAAPLRT